MGTMLPSPPVWIVSPVAANANYRPVDSAQVTGSTPVTCPAIVTPRLVRWLCDLFRHQSPGMKRRDGYQTALVASRTGGFIGWRRCPRVRCAGCGHREIGISWLSYCRSTPSLRPQVSALMQIASPLAC
jgi:hypothetical protein